MLLLDLNNNARLSAIFNSFDNVDQGPLGLPGRPGDPGDKGDTGKPGLVSSSSLHILRFTLFYFVLCGSFYCVSVEQTLTVQLIFVA